MCTPCGCNPHHHHMRRLPYHKCFPTNKEKKKRLESYAEALKKELTAVEERLKELEN
ncbi:MAG: hypothetical protein ACOC6H_02820 [Thermoproteota archaeon]